MAELNSMLDEVNDVEDDRDNWKRRLRVESSLAESLQSQRDRALRDLRERFGEDAVERAAFDSAACREEGHRKGWYTKERWNGGSDACREEGEEKGWGKEEWDGGGGGDGSGGGRSSVPLSVIAKALAPAYGSDDSVLLTDEAVWEAVRECRGIDSLSEQQQAERVGLDEFCAIARRLRRHDAV